MVRAKDLGLMAGIEPKTILDYGFGTYQGFFVENFIAQELRILDDFKERFFSWAKKTAEIEFVYDFENNPVPFEVKSGWVTKSKSLMSYTMTYNPKYKVLLSANNIKINHEQGFYKVPIYLFAKFFDYINKLNH